MSQHAALARAAAFCEKFNLRVPVLMAPMAGACPASLAIAIANDGGLGAVARSSWDRVRLGLGHRTFVRAATAGHALRSSAEHAVFEEMVVAQGPLLSFSAYG